MPHYNNSEINVVGIYYQGLYFNSELIQKIVPGKEVLLQREPDNKHDKNAVKVLFEHKELGYIPKTQAINLAPILDRGSAYGCVIKSKRRRGNSPEIIVSLTTYPIKRLLPVSTTPNPTPGINRPPVRIETLFGKQFRKISDFETWIAKFNGISGIYIIWNRKNKGYVGQSQNIGERWSNHLNQLRARRHENIRLQNDWTQMGADNFRFDVLEEIADLSSLDAAEKYYIVSLNTFFDGYNATIDGQEDPALIKTPPQPKQEIKIPPLTGPQAPEPPVRVNIAPPSIPLPIIIPEKSQNPPKIPSGPAPPPPAISHSCKYPTCQH